MAASRQGSSAMATGPVKHRTGKSFHSRVYDAPRELIWQMWTVPERVSSGGDPEVSRQRRQKWMCGQAACGST